MNISMTKVLGRSVLVALLWAGAAQAHAESNCVPNGDTSQRNACALKAFQEADTDNQVLYGDVMRILSAHERPSLRKDQRDWMRQREAQCKATHKPHEQQADWSQRYHACLIQAIQARNAVLKQWLHNGPPGG